MIEEYVKYKINKFFDNKKLYISFRNNSVFQILKNGSEKINNLN